MKLVQAWIEIHQEELLADWELAISGETIFKIDPLKVSVRPTHLVHLWLSARLL